MRQTDRPTVVIPAASIWSLPAGTRHRLTALSPAPRGLAFCWWMARPLGLPFSPVLRYAARACPGRSARAAADPIATAWLSAPDFAAIGARSAGFARRESAD